MIWRLFYLPLLLAAAFVSQASAQTPIQPGTIQGDLQAPFDCYVVELPAGSMWELTMDSSVFDTYLIVGRGTDCTVMQIDSTNDDGGSGRNARARFVSGGGTYLIAARGYATGAKGAYALTLAAGTRGGKTLPAGIEMPAFLKDASPASASTSPTPKNTTYRARMQFQDCTGACPMMVVVPTGSFMMGSGAAEEGRQGDEGPRHLVTVRNLFAIGKYEVTFDEWDACVAGGGCPAQPADQGWGRGKRPVMMVSWIDANRYVAWLTGKTGAQYFLPSEAEWEYAARAGTQTPWSTGTAIISDDANILNQFARTVPVGGFPANAWGLHDVHGNVAEWVRDCYDIGYFGMPTDGGAQITPGCRERGVRGGSMIQSALPPDVRSARREHPVPQRSKRQASGFASRGRCEPPRCADADGGIFVCRRRTDPARCAARAAGPRDARRHRRAWRRRPAL